MEYKLTFTRFPYAHYLLADLWGRARQLIAPLLQADAAPSELARAFALGTFISLLPTPGLNMVLTAVIAATCKGIHRGALLASLGVWNALVLAPIYTLGYQLGTVIVGDTVVPTASFILPEKMMQLGLGFFVGNTVLAFVVTAVAYMAIWLLTPRLHSATN